MSTGPTNARCPRANGIDIHYVEVGEGEPPLMKADHDTAQGGGYWKMVLCQTFDRVSKPSGYSLADLGTVTPQR